MGDSAIVRPLSAATAASGAGGIIHLHFADDAHVLHVFEFALDIRNRCI